MNETLRELEQAVEAVRVETRALLRDGSDKAAEQIKTHLAALHATEARIAATRLEVLGEAQLSGQAAAVVDQERNTSRLSSAEASGNAGLGRELTTRFWILAEALYDGAISVSQARAIIHGLKKLPGHLGPHQLEQCQREMLAHCDTLGPDELRTLATRLWELMDPDSAEDAEAARLAREEHRAHAGRAFRLSPDHHGSMRITGQLPVADAAQLGAVLDALMPSAASYATDGEDIPDPDARRAVLTDHHGG